MTEQQKEASVKEQVVKKVKKLMVSMIRAVREDHKSIMLGK